MKTNKKPKTSIVGNKYFQLTILEDLGTYVKCQCNCGSEPKLILKANVIREGGHTKSCGCLALKTHNRLYNTVINDLYQDKVKFEIPTLTRFVSRYITQDFWKIIKLSGSKRNLEFNIEPIYIEELFIKQEGRCAISGVLITLPKNFNERKLGQHTASLDRIDSSKGYINGNVQWVHRQVNFIKGSLSDSELIKWCVIITNYQNSSDYSI